MRIQVVQTALGAVEYSDAGEGEPILYFDGAGVAGETNVSKLRRLTAPT